MALVCFIPEPSLFQITAPTLAIFPYRIYWLSVSVLNPLQIRSKPQISPLFQPKSDPNWSLRFCTDWTFPILFTDLYITLFPVPKQHPRHSSVDSENPIHVPCLMSLTWPYWILKQHSVLLHFLHNREPTAEYWVPYPPNWSAIGLPYYFGIHFAYILVVWALHLWETTPLGSPTS